MGTKNSFGKIVVGVSFDDHTDNLVEAGYALCKKTGYSLRLVHVCEPWIGAVGLGILPVSEVNETIQADLMNKAAENLDDIAKKYSNGVDITTNVLLGDIVESLIADAVANQAKLIICGAQSEIHGFMPKGFSTALSLMGNAPVPVFVLPRGKDIDWKKDKLTVMVADDLSHDGEKVIQAALDWAEKVNCHLIHVHATGLTKADIEAAITMAVSAARSTISPEITPDEFLKSFKKVLTDRIEARLSTRRQQLEKAGSTYEYKILDGDPAFVIEEEAARSKADIVIFGRHKTFHSKPFLIGRVPFKTMVNKQHAVIIVPPEYKS